MLDKKAYSVQMNYTVPESEKRVAEKAEEYLEDLLVKLQNLTEYLNIIYLPFKKYQNVDMEMIAEYRKTFKQYKDQVIIKFENIKKLSYQTIGLMNNFSTDTSTSEILDSFINSIKDLEKYIDTFISIFLNFNNTEFPKYIISTIDSITKKINQIDQLIKDRVLEHIDTNILAKSWTKDLKEYTDKSLEERVPLVVQLFKERQDALGQSNK
jgi:hypothetical protein